MNGKVLYLGSEKQFTNEEWVDGLSKLFPLPFEFVREKKLSDLLEHFYQDTPILLLLIEDSVKDVVSLVHQLKGDEVFQFLPIFYLMHNNDPFVKRNFWRLGIDQFFLLDVDLDELILAALVTLKYKTHLDNLLESLRQVTEESITKGIQLDILRRYTSLTLWRQSFTLAEEQRIEIPEEEEKLAILYGDLEYFTTMSEGRSPGEVVSVLNHVFDIVTRHIQKQKGDVDKFIGDAVLAVFEKPEHALFAAIEIQKDLEILNEEKSKKGELALRLRIGLHYGQTIRGSVGGNDRFDNTLIGDSINTAQRLESQAPGGGILVSKALCDKVQGLKDATIEFQPYELKGKQVTVMAVNLMELYNKEGAIKAVIQDLGVVD